MFELLDHVLAPVLVGRWPSWMAPVVLTWCVGCCAYAVHQAGWALGLWADRVHDEERIPR